MSDLFAPPQPGTVLTIDGLAWLVETVTYASATHALTLTIVRVMT